MRVGAAASGNPQCGHDIACEETSLLHSGHLVSGIVVERVSFA
jgi:hypothetical protein